MTSGFLLLPASSSDLCLRLFVFCHDQSKYKSSSALLFEGRFRISFALAVELLQRA
jgi:hypothetical protein